MYSESAGSLTELTFEPSERGAVATAISNSGVIAGYEWTALGSQGCGGVFAPGFWTVQGGAQLLTGELTCYTMPAGVNDTGIIVGTYSNSGFPGYVAVAWSGANEATETGLPPLECDHCNRITVRATAVNDAGVIVGSSSYFSSCSYNEGGCPAPYPDGYYAVEWVNDSPINLGGQHDSHANAINNGTPALIVGQAGGDAAVWTAPGKVTDLGTLPGDNESEADAVNDVGEIVGQSMVVTANQDNVARAFLYVNGKMYDLNSLIDPTTPLPASTTLSSAVGINSQGWIAADATVTSTGPYGQNGATVTETTAAPHAYLLIPND